MLVASSETCGHQGPREAERKMRNGCCSYCLCLEETGIISIHSPLPDGVQWPHPPTARDSGKWKEHLEYVMGLTVSDTVPDMMLG